MKAFWVSLALWPVCIFADEVAKYKITKDVDESDVRLQSFFYCLDDQKAELEKFIRSSTPEIRTFREAKIRFGDAARVDSRGGELQNDGRTLILKVRAGDGVPPPGGSAKAGCEVWTSSQIAWFLKEAHLKQVEKVRYERTYEKQNRKRTPKVDGRLVDGKSTDAAAVPPVPEALAPTRETSVPTSEVKGSLSTLKVERPTPESAVPTSEVKTPTPASASGLETVPVAPPSWSQ